VNVKPSSIYYIRIGVDPSPSPPSSSTSTSLNGWCLCNYTIMVVQGADEDRLIQYRELQLRIFGHAYESMCTRYLKVPI
jgi:hypothetical protein